MSVFTVYTALIVPLVACTDQSSGIDDAGVTLNAAHPLSIETSGNADINSNEYSDASNSNPVTTDGFVGEVLDDTIRISWKKDPDATGYNVYRQGEYYTTVFGSEFNDVDINIQDYTYKITAFEKNGEDTRYYTIATGLTVSVPPKSVDGTYFSSSATDGFVGEVLNDTIRISWKEDPDASGYNVYRQGKYYTTVFQTEFLDTDIVAQDYTYKITAFEKNGENTRYYTIANGLTVSVPLKSGNDNIFESPVTDGFMGEVLDDTIRVSWQKDPDATGYNVYRQGNYYTTVFDTEFHDADIQVQDYAYKITAFEKNGEDTRYYTIATGLTVAVRNLGGGGDENPEADPDAVYPGESENIDISDPDGAVEGKTPPPVTDSTAPESADTDSSNDSEPENSQQNGTDTTDTEPLELPDTASPVQTDKNRFESVTTEGFIGEVLDNSIRISWKVDPEASGYNVYRQAEYYTTVFTNEFHDTKVYDEDYYYEIQAFEHRVIESDTRYYYIATGLTVSARTLGKTDPDRPKTNEGLLNDYELVFADEFNGNSLDASKWNTSFLWGTDLIINGEEQYYVDILKDPEFGFNPFTFDGNNMTINTIKTPPELAQKSLDQPYLSGIITSYDAFKFTYGYAEVRARMTHGRGYWPAFWLLNAYYGGEDPEIDIMEFIGDNQDVVYHTFHYHDDSGKLRSSKSEPTPGIDYTSDFHTFSVEWKPGSIIYYVDGIEVHRITDPKVPREQMYLIANTAVGGWWAGSPDASTPFPGEYVIDYIRVYQKNTLYNDMLYNDGMTNVPYADDIPNQALPNHRPTLDQWPEGYPYH